jgi:hypothetical protein
MEGFNQDVIKQEITSYLKNIYNSYDNTGTGILSGDQQLKFCKDYDVSENESKTFDDFTNKYFNRMSKLLNIITELLKIKDLVFTKKNINFKINHDDTISAKTNFSLNLTCNPKQKKTLINDIYPNSEYNLSNTDKTFAMIKFYCNYPTIVEGKLEKIIQVIFLLISIKNKDISTDLFKYEIFKGDYVMLC